MPILEFDKFQKMHVDFASPEILHSIAEKPQTKILTLLNSQH